MNMKTTIHPSEWGSQLEATAHARLGDAARGIHKLHQETVTFVARKQIEVGRLLLVARAEFKGDNEFGKWREANTPIKSRQSAFNLMQLAKQAGEGRITDKLIATLPTSTLAELIAAPDTVLRAVEARVEQGEHVTAKEIRADKKEAAAEKVEIEGEPAIPTKQPKLTPDKARRNIEAAEKVIADRGVPEEQFFANIVESPVEAVIDWFVDKRGDNNITKAMTQEWAMVIYGVPPFSDGVPRWQVFELMHREYESTEFKVWQKDILAAAWSTLKKMYGK